ncbi:hypothetical protein A3A03_02060 [Candidatus Nomurabacteria bacterium RIFCSPLOWO2_01_FULL_40_18]|uniref:PsbP C-terminal domain-containing protein n=1 Tax=Candidatus Nomurabacteria bacterium RIFCSPLOWO2_01_FULL_40_18 TaxID=1801773 RepID=A0A1F6XIM3_9BACT|nr:MAG: hypothetical protein A3A03_02060 [Candidatus Nomurabacteria bacterium RIFCSPLOWO2_01_FULL_40_18]
MKNNFKKGFIVSVILGIISLLLIGGGVYLYKNKKAVAPTVETEQSNQNQQQTDTQTPPVNIQSDTSNWKTYTNSSLKYSVKYPSNWYAGSSSDEFAFIRNWEVDAPLSLNWQKANNMENISIDIVSYINATNPAYINVKDEALADWTKDVTDKHTILVDGIKAVRGYSLSEGQKVGTVTLVFNGKVYFLAYSPYDSKLVSTFDQILSTFKFTK